MYNTITKELEAFMEDYGATFVTITDDDGINYEMEILSRFEYLDNEYVALIPADADDESEDSQEVNILRVVIENGEEVLEAIESEAELNGAYEELMQLMFDEEE